MCPDGGIAAVSVRPAVMDLLLGVKPPDGQPRMGGANDSAHALGLCVQFPMAEYAAHEDGGLRLLDIQAHETVPCMAQTALVEIAVKGKQCRLTEAQRS